MNENAKRTAQRLAMLKHSGHVEPRRRVPRQQFPFTIEVEYAKRLIGYVDSVRAAMNPIMHELPARLAAVRARRDAHESDRIHHMIEELRGRMLSREQLQLAVSAFGHRIAAHQRQQFAKQVKAALGVDPALIGVDMHVAGGKLADFVAENVSLIRSLTTTPLGEVQNLVTRSFAAGDRHEDLAQEIEGRFDVARSRARLIARDQTGKLNAQMARDGNKQIGVDRWRWRSMRDDAVRDEHRELDRQSEIEPFSYSGDDGEVPPILPGEEVQCRCYDEAVFDDILTALEDEAA